MFLVKRTLLTILGMLFMAMAVCSGIIARHLFKAAHFLVTDSVGDQREMQDFSGGTPYWADILSNFPFYIPSFIAALIAFSLVGIGGAWILRALSGHREINNKLNTVREETGEQVGDGDAEEAV